jgi:hypothetical protein
MIKNVASGGFLFRACVARFRPGVAGNSRWRLETLSVSAADSATATAWPSPDSVNSVLCGPLFPRETALEPHRAEVLER